MLRAVERTPARPSGVPDDVARGRALLPGLLAALAWGLAVPALKRESASMSAHLASGWMNAAAGLGLTVYLAVRGRARRGAPLARPDLPWLAGATLAGGVVGPYALLRGVEAAPAHVAALLLNLEVVFTTALAVAVFRERATRARWAGALLVTAGGLLVAYGGAREGEGGADPAAGAAWIALAGLAWAFDNNLTRRIAGRDAPTVARAKVLVGGSLALGLAAATGGWSPAPEARAWVAVALVGLVGVGVSLTLFIVSLRRVGATRTSVLFGTAPFVGAAASALVLGEAFSAAAVVGAVVMAAGVAAVALERPLRL
jgi:drug/metabolite transporter (DMT)-like permease